MTRDTALGYAKAAALIAVCISAFNGGSYLFGTPSACECRANISPDLANASLINNSVGDATTILIKTYADFGSDGEIRICYPKKPSRGSIDYDPGVPDKNCKFSNSYQFWWKRFRGTKTDTKSTINFQIFEDTLSSPAVIEGANEDERREKRREEAAKGPAIGSLDLDRSTDVCKFQAKDWNTTTAVGEMTCRRETGYFNVWSVFPQHELFYPRMFYWFHKPEPKT